MKILIETIVDGTDGLLTSLGVGSIQTPFLKIFFMLGQLGLFISLEIDFSSSGCSVLASGTGMSFNEMLLPKDRNSIQTHI